MRAACVELIGRTVPLPCFCFSGSLFNDCLQGLFSYHSNPYLKKRLAAMSFDRYFEAMGKQSHRSQSSDDWYAIVEEALFAADVASRRHRQQLEIGLMKPLPMIPEDDASDLLDLGRVRNWTCRSNSAIAGSVHQKGADWKQGNLPWTDGQQHYSSEISNDYAISRRPSSIYSAELDSPLSPESIDLDTWASNVCPTDQGGMSSLRSKPYSRPSSLTGSAVSERPISTGSSVAAGRSRSTTSSVYSTDTSVDSHSGSAESVRLISGNLPESFARSPNNAGSVQDSRTSFFDFSDDEGEEGEEVTVARAESSASNYVKQLRKKALSLRMSTSKKAQVPVRTISMAPPKTSPALPTWLFRSSTTDRTSVLSLDKDIVLENQLMAHAAASAKAKRVLGVR